MPDREQLKPAIDTRCDWTIAGELDAVATVQPCRPAPAWQPEASSSAARQTILCRGRDRAGRDWTASALAELGAAVVASAPVELGAGRAGPRCAPIAAVDLDA